MLEEYLMSLMFWQKMEKWMWERKWGEELLQKVISIKKTLYILGGTGPSKKSGFSYVFNIYRDVGNALRLLHPIHFQAAQTTGMAA